MKTRHCALSSSFSVLCVLFALSRLSHTHHFGGVFGKLDHARSDKLARRPGGTEAPAPRDETTPHATPTRLFTRDDHARHRRRAAPSAPTHATSAVADRTHRTTLHTLGCVRRCCLLASHRRLRCRLVVGRRRLPLPHLRDGPLVRHLRPVLPRLRPRGPRLLDVLVGRRMLRLR